LPVAVEVFDGNTADPATLAAQIAKLKQRFALERVVLVGDRGMLTSARIREEVEPAGFDWISCLRSDAIQKLASDDGPLQLSLFDERDLAEITAPEQFPGERLIVCRNPLLAQERARKREALLTATERDLARIAERVQARRAPLRGAAEIGRAVGAVVSKHKMAKHFEIEIGEAQLTWRRKSDGIAHEARLDGVYVVRTSVTAAALDADETVQAYKDLAQVERAFRCLKTVDLDILPIRHWTAERVRAHVFLCMLAYHVEWHLRRALAPLLFHDTDIVAARAERSSPVAKTEPSPTAKTKKAIKRNPAGQPVMNFADLLAHLGTLARNTLTTSLQKGHSFTLHTRPTAIQETAFQLLEIDPTRVQ
jgi:transposase